MKYLTACAKAVLLTVVLAISVVSAGCEAEAECEKTITTSDADTTVVVTDNGDSTVTVTSGDSTTVVKCGVKAGAEVKPG